MNKKLSVIAVSAALALGSLSVQAETKIYGVAHVSVDSLSGLADKTIDSDGDGTNDDVGIFVSSNASRIGFSGDVDAGEGLKGIWKIEQGVALDSGGASLSNYNSYAGLSGGFGTAMIGYHDSPVKLVGRKVDLFGDTIADSRSIIGAGAGANFAEKRLGGIGYMNKFGDVGLMVGYVPQDTNGENATGFVVSVDYSMKDMYVGLGYHSLSAEMGGNPDGDSESAMRLGFMMKFGTFGVNALYQTVDGYSANGDNSRATMGLGGSMGLGDAGTLKLQYYAAGANDNAATDDGATMVALGYDHKLGKDVTVYAVYAGVTNDDAGKYKVGGGGHGTASQTITTAASDGTTEANSGISLGMKFKF